MKLCSTADGAVSCIIISGGSYALTKLNSQGVIDPDSCGMMSFQQGEQTQGGNSRHSHSLLCQKLGKAEVPNGSVPLWKLNLVSAFAGRIAAEEYKYWQLKVNNLIKMQVEETTTKKKTWKPHLWMSQESCSLYSAAWLKLDSNLTCISH